MKTAQNQNENRLMGPPTKHLYKRLKSVWTVMNEFEVSLLFAPNDLEAANHYCICRFYLRRMIGFLDHAGYTEAESVSLLLPDTKASPIEFKLWKTEEFPMSKMTRFVGFAQNDEQLKISLDLSIIGFEAEITSKAHTWWIKSIDRRDHIYLIHE